MKSSAPETLLWIGPRRHGDFVELFRQAESLVPQIAYRSSLFAALDRPATRVDRVLIARVDSCGPLPDDEEKLRRLYPQADIVTVTGSLCTARPATRLHESTGNTSLRRVAWHQAGPFLRGWLANRTVAGGRERTSDAQRTAAAAGPRAASIAVFASRYSDAEALLDLADADGAAAFWCRSPAQLTARNIDLFWWDDSVTEDSGATTWNDRFAQVAAAASAVARHVWLVGLPSHARIVAATAAGVDEVISKPLAIDAILSTIGSPAGNDDAGRSAKPRLAA